MTPDEYVRAIVGKYALVGGRLPSATAAAQTAYAVIQSWAGQWLLAVTYSGSGVKGTAIAGTSDVDLFISLKTDTPGTLADLYTSLGNYSGFKTYSPRWQNVSIGITVAGHQIDLVPGRKQAGNTTDHSLYRSKAKTWTQTNVATHVSLIQGSQRLEEIRATKIWRTQHKLDFPSFYLEMTVLDALAGRKIGDVANNVWIVFTYLKEKFANAVVIDPANTNNKLSDDLSNAEKKHIVDKATASLGADNWSKIIW